MATIFAATEKGKAMRLIDAKAVEKKMRELLRPCDIGFAIRAVREVPTVDAVPVVHGRWIPIEEKLWNLDIPVVVDWKCSNCNAIGHEDFRYCPNCGAKMDGEKHE